MSEYGNAYTMLSFSKGAIMLAIRRSAVMKSGQHELGLRISAALSHTGYRFSTTAIDRMISFSCAVTEPRIVEQSSSCAVPRKHARRCVL